MREAAVAGGKGLPEGAGLEQRLRDVGVVIDLLRVSPGDEGDLLRRPQQLPLDNSECLFLSFGEWDVMRLALVTELPSEYLESRLWPPAQTGVLNQNRFLAYLWQDEESGEPLIEFNRAQGIYVFTPAFLAPQAPVCLVTCVHLNSRILHQDGVVAERRLLKRVQELSAKAGVQVLACGGVGWHDLVLISRAETFEVGREFVRNVCALTYTFDPPSPLASLTVPAASRTVTYPGIAAGPVVDGHDGTPEKSFSARILLDLKPGVATTLSNAGVRDAECAEEFGEYDLVVSIPSATTWRQVVDRVTAIRSESKSPGGTGWLAATATILDFESKTVDQAWPEQGPQAASGAIAELKELSEVVSTLRWHGVPRSHSERLLSLTRRALLNASDPELAEFVAPIVTYILALGRTVQEAAEVLRADSLAPIYGRPAAAMYADDVDLICSLLEHALRQRTEAAQPFLHNTLPPLSHHYGASRLLFAADAVLRETCAKFQLESPGFVVFGLSVEAGFAAFGPVVAASTRSLLEPELWWLIFHEAATFVDDQLLGEAAFSDMVPRFHRREQIAEKLIVDLITLALPFQGDLSLFRTAHAERLASIKSETGRRMLPAMARRLVAAALARECLGSLAKNAAGPWFKSEPAPALGAWGAALKAASEDLCTKKLSNGAFFLVDDFLRECWESWPADRRRQDLPSPDHLEDQILPGVVRNLEFLACLAEDCARAPKGNDRPATALATLMGLLGHPWRADTNDSMDANTPGRGIAPLVYRAVAAGRARGRDSSEVRRGDVDRSFRRRVGLFLDLWDRATNRCEGAF